MSSTPEKYEQDTDTGSDVLSQLNTSRSLFASYLRIRSSASSSTSPELIEARNELQNVLRELQGDIEDLVETVKAVESDPYAFGLQIEEVQRRRRLVDEVGDEVMKMHEELVKTVQNAHKGKGPANGSYLPDPSTFDDEDDYAAEFEQQRQQEIMQEQDQVLDGVFRTVGTLRQQADVFGHELEEQGQLLEEADVVADRVGVKLQSGMKRIGQVIKQNEGISLERNHSILAITS
jgi:member of the syntaxin family of t-SNAREs